MSDKNKLRWLGVHILSRAMTPILATFLIINLIMMPSIVNADIVPAPIVADAHIYSEDPNTAKGTWNYMTVRAGNPGFVHRMLVEFDLSTIPSGAIINSATLSLYYYTWSACADPGGRTLDIYRIIQDWEESEVTWNSASSGTAWSPTSGGSWTVDGKSSAQVPTSTGTWMTWDVTNIVKAWIENGESNYGFIIRDPVDGTFFSECYWANFRTREWGTVDERPILEIDWSPGHPVGGVFAPVNKIAILTQYIALMGLVGIVTTILAIKRWCKA